MELKDGQTLRMLVACHLINRITSQSITHSISQSVSQLRCPKGLLFAHAPVSPVSIQSSSLTLDLSHASLHESKLLERKVDESCSLRTASFSTQSRIVDMYTQHQYPIPDKYPIQPLCCSLYAPISFR